MQLIKKYFTEEGLIDPITKHQVKRKAQDLCHFVISGLLSINFLEVGA